MPLSRNLDGRLSNRSSSDKLGSLHGKTPSQPGALHNVSTSLCQRPAKLVKLTKRKLFS